MEYLSCVVISRPAIRRGRGESFLKRRDSRGVAAHRHHVDLAGAIGARIYEYLGLSGADFSGTTMVAAVVHILTNNEPYSPSSSGSWRRWIIACRRRLKVPIEQAL